MVFDPSKITNEVRLVQTYSNDEFMEKVCENRGVTVVGTSKLYADLHRSYKLRNMSLQKNRESGIPVLVKPVDYEDSFRSFQPDNGLGVLAYLGAAESEILKSEGYVFMSRNLAKFMGYHDHLLITLPFFSGFSSESQELLR